MTVYNGGAYLRQAIDSILLQTLRDFELIIVDDGSTDESCAVVGSYADSRIVLVASGQHLGRTPALNEGLRRARGTYVAPMDADDVAGPTRLATQVAFLDQHPDVALVGSRGIVIGPDGSVVHPYWVPTGTLDVHWTLLFGNPFIHSAVMMRRKVALDDLGGYDTTFTWAQDYDLWSRIAYGHKVANLRQNLVSWRIHNASLSKHVADRGQREALAIRLRNLARACGHMSVEEQELLLVMGRGYRGEQLRPDITPSRAVAIYRQAVERFLHTLPAGLGSESDAAMWRPRREVRALWFLADAYLRQGAPRQARLGTAQQ